MGKIKSALGRFWSQSAIAILLFLLFVFIGGLVSGLIQVFDFGFRSVPVYVPVFVPTVVFVQNWAGWLAVFGASASIAAFISTWLRRKIFVYYKIVDYPADHLKILHEIKGKPKTIEDIAVIFDIPPSVAERVLEDLWVDGLLQKMGDGDRSIYYFPFEKKLAQMMVNGKEEDVKDKINKFAKKK
jgi:predicted transcriptional regulator